MKHINTCVTKIENTCYLYNTFQTWTSLQCWHITYYLQKQNIYVSSIIMLQITIIHINNITYYQSSTLIILFPVPCNNLMTFCKYQFHIIMLCTSNYLNTFYNITCHWTNHTDNPNSFNHISNHHNTHVILHISTSS